MLIEGLYSVLSNDANLQASLGTSGGRSDSTTGMFPGLAPEETPFPYLVYQQVGGEPLQTSMQGTGALRTERWRFTSYGSTYKQAKEVSRVLNQVMVSIIGTLPEGAAEVHGVWEKLDADDFEGVGKGTIYACHRDYEINFIDADTD